MAKITATGEYLLSRITVEVTQVEGELVITMEGRYLAEIQEDFEYHIANQPAMGGTYYPESNSMLAAYNVLQNTFFDSLESITVEGDIGTIPMEEGVIY